VDRSIVATYRILVGSGILTEMDMIPQDVIFSLNDIMRVREMNTARICDIRDLPLWRSLEEKCAIGDREKFMNLCIEESSLIPRAVPFSGSRERKEGRESSE